MFDNVFSPIKIGTMQVKNRLSRSAAATNYAAVGGAVTPLLMDFYAEQARGGVGLIMVETSYVDEKGSRGLEREMAISRDDCIPGLAKVAKAIKENGARAGIQLGHLGGGRALGPPLVAPSAVPYGTVMGDKIPQELSIEEIKEIADAFGLAALRAKEAGFEIVEIHSAHEHLLGQFLTPNRNKRTDVYGGALENRIRFPLEVLDNVRRRVGDNFPICVKISVTDFIPGGVTTEDSIEFARQLERNGADIIHASAGGLITVNRTIQPIYYHRGCHVYLAEMIKRVVNIPVMAVGSITSLDLAEEIVVSGKADMICVCRALLADPCFPQKAKEGKANEIRPCIRCTEGCFGSIMKNEPVTCTVNAELAIKYDKPLERVAKARKVAVIGGGPAGLEAARVAALRGHQVTLYEKRGRLGGYLIEDSIPEYKKERRELINYFVNQLEKLGVMVNQEEATVKTLEQKGFDAVVVATGAKKETPRLKGADKAFVINAVDVYHDKTKGHNVVVIASEWEVGCCDVALYLAEQGKKTTLLFSRDMMEVMTAVSAIAFPADMMALWEVMPQRGIEIHYGMKVKEVSHGVVVASDKEERKSTFPADTVVVVPRFTSNDALAKELTKHKLEVHTIGDCVEPRRIYHAIHEGHAIGRQL